MTTLGKNKVTSSLLLTLSEIMTLERELLSPVSRNIWRNLHGKGESLIIVYLNSSRTKQNTCRLEVGDCKSKITALGINRTTKGRNRKRVFLLEKMLFVLEDGDICCGCIIYAESWSQVDVCEHDVVGSESPRQVLHPVIKQGKLSFRNICLRLVCWPTGVKKKIELVRAIRNLLEWHNTAPHFSLCRMDFWILSLFLLEWE